METRNDIRVSHLAERNAEFRQLRREYAECAAGRGGRTIIIEGAAGTGKSELLDAVVGHALDSSAVVLRAVDLRERTTVPFDTVRRLAAAGAPPGLAPASVLPAPPAGGDDVHHGVLSGSPFSSVRPHDVTAFLHGFSNSLLRASEDSPLVIAVDDFFHADADSVNFLLDVMRQARTSRVMLVGTLPTHPDLHGSHDRPAPAALLRQPNFRRIRLEPLSAQGVAQVLTAHTGLPEDPERTRAFAQASGGSPLLLRALIEDTAAAVGSDRPPLDACPKEPVVGPALTDTALSCLQRAGGRVQDLAVAVAVLGEEATPTRLAQLLRLHAADVRAGLSAMTGAGLLDGCRLRHDAVAHVLLARTTPDALTSLHDAAAALLYADGAPATEIAAHLWAGEPCTAPWHVPVLREAAEAVLAEDLGRVALEYLERAHAGCADPVARMELKLRIATVSRRYNPAAAERHLADAVTALRTGGLPTSLRGTLARELVGHGRIGEAEEVLSLDEDAAADSQLTVLCASSEHREARGEDSRAHPGAAPPATPVLDLAAAGVRAAVSGWLVPPGGRRSPGQPGPEDVLRLTVLTDNALTTVVHAVRGLLYTGQPARARYWCDELLAQAEQRGAPGWQAVFTWLRAEVALYHGHAVDAERQARTALALLPERHDGALAGALAGILVASSTMQGDYEAASRTLDQPVANALFQSVHGLTYRRARGRYYLATRRFHAALGEFLAIGQISGRWGLERSAVLPWRTDAAAAYAGLGDVEQAMQLVTQEVVQSGPGAARTRGVALRLQASLLPVHNRPKLLTRAAEVLHATDDRLELACTLYDLSEAHRELGEPGEAFSVLRHAWHIASECGAVELCRRMCPESIARVPRPRAVGAVETVPAALSESERRVAALAAYGYTNKQIAGRLFITVSTVEQHLTKVYRKLDIAGRRQLPGDLTVDLDESA